MEFLALVCFVIGVCAMFEHTWWLIAPPWVAGFAFLILAGVT